GTVQTHTCPADPPSWDGPATSAGTARTGWAGRPWRSWRSRSRGRPRVVDAVASVLGVQLAAAQLVGHAAQTVTLTHLVEHQAQRVQDSAEHDAAGDRIRHSHD